MNDVMRRTWNTYSRHDGYVMAWEKSEEAGVGHKVTVLDQDRRTIDLQWRAAHEPAVGQRVSAIMVSTGVTTRPERPVLVLNHDTGDVIREQNAPPPRGTRPIMIALSVWVLAALGLSCMVIAFSEGITTMILILLSTAFLVWRLAIATSELRHDERAQRRIQDEDRLCMDILLGEWRMASEERIDMRVGKR